MFEDALNKTLAYEGVYSMNQNDRGGETVYGISRNNFPDWEGWKFIDGLKKKIDAKEMSSFISENFENSILSDMVKDFYFMEFWERCMCDEMGRISPGIAAKVFDMAVNMGIMTAGKLFQQALNIAASNLLEDRIKEDGIIGEKTLNLFRVIMAGATEIEDMKVGAYILTKLKELAAKRYAEIVSRKHSQAVFIKGWINRAFS